MPTPNPVSPTSAAAPSAPGAPVGERVVFWTPEPAEVPRDPNELIAE